MYRSQKDYNLDIKQRNICLRLAGMRVSVGGICLSDILIRGVAEMFHINIEGNIISNLICITMLQVNSQSTP